MKDRRSCRVQQWFGSVPPAWLEHATYGLGNRRSIQLSYGSAMNWQHPPGLPLHRPDTATPGSRLQDGRRPLYRHPRSDS
jgi:hypothetical protein